MKSKKCPGFPNRSIQTFKRGFGRAERAKINVRRGWDRKRKWEGLS